MANVGRLSGQPRQLAHLADIFGGSRNYEFVALSEDFAGAEAANVPWQGNPERVLDEINDLSGIEEP